MSKRKRKNKGETFDVSADYAETRPRFAGVPERKYPAFSLRYVCCKGYSTSACTYEKLKAFNSQLRILSSLAWNEINSAPRTTNGWEPIPCDQIRATLPSSVPALDDLMVFRFGGKTTGGRIAGYREGTTFYVLFVDSSWSLYDHG